MMKANPHHGKLPRPDPPETGIWSQFLHRTRALFSVLRTGRRMAWATLAPLTVAATDARPPVGAPSLEIPIDCQVGVECFVQNFVDVDPSPDYLDFSCGHLSYDGHKGTDFRLPDLPSMHHGVIVRAAAPGVIRAVRDGMPDISVRDADPESIKGREAGNAVAIRHAQGWETQYSHMRKGSVSVKPGQKVLAGDKLGLVGLSGQTEFPHLHFAVRHDGKPIDPFSGLPMGRGCGDTDNALWSQAAASQLSYLATGLLGNGFTDAIPKAEQARAGKHSHATLPGDAPLIIYWVDVFGTQTGDVQRMRLSAPDGTVLASAEQVLDRTQAQRFSYIGKRLRAPSWPPGTYRAEYTLSRRQDGKTETVVRGSRRVEVLPE